MSDEIKLAVEDMVHCRDRFHVFAQGGIGRDGGDGLNRMGVAYSCMAALNSPVDDLGVSLKIGLGYTIKLNQDGNLPCYRFRRHPDPTRWYYNPNNVTRDQMVPLEAAMALVGLTSIAREHAKARAKRFFFHFSGENDGADAGPLVIKKWYQLDPPSLSELGTIIRACRAWWLRPLLNFLDLQLLVDISVGRSLNDRNLWDSDNQLVPQTLAAIQVYPSLVSRLARFVYSKKANSVCSRLIQYHKQGEMPELGKLLILAYLKIICKNP